MTDQIRSPELNERPTKLWAFLIAVLVLCASIVFAYRPGLAGEFLLDDYPNIVFRTSVQIETLSIAKLWVAIDQDPTGIIGRPIPTLTFILDYMRAGLQPHAFLITNLAIHALASLTIFWLAYTLASRGTLPQIPVAMLASAAWALHPLNLTGVLYIVQRMTSLSALFALVAIVLYVRLRSELRPSWQRIITLGGLCGLCMLFSVMSKENGVLVPLLLLLTERLLNSIGVHARNQSQNCAFALLVALPSVAVLASLCLMLPNFVDGYHGRPFSLSERLLTEMRVVADYLGQLAWPRITDMTLFGDDVTTSTSLLKPPATALSTLTLTLLLAIPIAFNQRMPWLSFGLAFYFVGHLLESTVVPLELYFEHRNYLPSAGLIVGLVGQVAQWTLAIPARMQRAVGAAASVIVLSLAFQTNLRASLWGHPNQHIAFALEHRPNSARVQWEAAEVALEGCLKPDPTGPFNAEPCQKAIKHFEKSADLDGTAAGLIKSAEIRAALDKPVNDELHLRIRRSLQDGAPAWVWINVLSDLAATPATRRPLPSTLLATWVEDALKNPRLAALGRAALLNAYAQLLFNEMHQPELALQAMNAAVSVQPGRFDLRINLIELYIAMADTEAGRNALQEAKRLKGSWAYASNFERLASELDALRS